MPLVISICPYFCESPYLFLFVYFIIAKFPSDLGKMIISLSLNITMNQVGGASVIAKFHS